MKGQVMIDPVLLSEIRDFLQDISTGSPVTDASRDHATEFVALMDCPEDGQPQSLPASYRWRQPGNKHWIYDPTPEWIEDHKHEIEMEALFASSVSRIDRNLGSDDAN